MIAPEEVTELIHLVLPDAEVELTDRTGMSDHFAVKVISQAFAGKNPLDRHRLVYEALSPAMHTGRLHAIEIQTALPNG